MCPMCKNSKKIKIIWGNQSSESEIKTCPVCENGINLDLYEKMVKDTVFSYIPYKPSTIPTCKYSPLEVSIGELIKKKS